MEQNEINFIGTERCERQHSILDSPISHTLQSFDIHIDSFPVTGIPSGFIA